jgi:hypothetical protein
MSFCDSFGAILSRLTYLAGLVQARPRGAAPTTQERGRPHTPRRSRGVHRRPRQRQILARVRHPYTGGWPQPNLRRHLGQRDQATPRHCGSPSIVGPELRRAAREVFLPAVAPHDAEPSGNDDIGTRYRSTISLRQRSSVSSRGGERRVGCVRQVEAPDHDYHRAGLHLVQCRGIPPRLPAEASPWVHLPLPEGLRRTVEIALALQEQRGPPAMRSSIGSVTTLSNLAAVSFSRQRSPPSMP